MKAKYKKTDKLMHKNVKYNRAIVTFIDILGFKNIVENSTPEEVKNIYNIISAFQLGNENVPKSTALFEDE